MAKSSIDGILGIWILLSPWLLGFASMSVAKWSCVLVGLALIVTNAWELFSEKPDGGPGGASLENQK